MTRHISSCIDGERRFGLTEFMLYKTKSLLFPGQNILTTLIFILQATLIHSKESTIIFSVLSITTSRLSYQDALPSLLDDPCHHGCGYYNPGTRGHDGGKM